MKLAPAASTSPRGEFAWPYVAGKGVHTTSPSFGPGRHPSRPSCVGLSTLTVRETRDHGGKPSGTRGEEYETRPHPEATS
jgi:hypothetical protein